MPDLRQPRRDAALDDAEGLPATSLVSHHGSAFSVAPTLTQSAWFRPHNKDPRAIRN